MNDAALATGQMSEPVTTNVSPDKTVAIVSIPLHGNGTDETSDAALASPARRRHPGRRSASVAGIETNVTGMTAGSKDFNDTMNVAPADRVRVRARARVPAAARHVPRRSSCRSRRSCSTCCRVGAAYGILTLVFQDGHVESLLDFESVGGITSWLPLFLFVILFGLSMDYHVFILSRIREAVDGGMTTDDAVAHGIKADGRRRDQRGGRDGRGVRDLRAR